LISYYIVISLFYFILFILFYLFYTWHSILLLKLPPISVLAERVCSNNNLPPLIIAKMKVSPITQAALVQSWQRIESAVVTVGRMGKTPMESTKLMQRLHAKAVEAFTVCDQLFGEQEARDWGSDFRWPTGVRQRDSLLAAVCNWSLTAMAAHTQANQRAHRLSEERVRFWVSTTDPDYDNVMELATEGMHVLTAAEFKANGVVTELRRLYKDRVTLAVNKALCQLWVKQRVFILPMTVIHKLKETVHWSPVHWTKNFGKASGRPLIDTSDSSQGPALNSDEAGQKLEDKYGKIEHPTLETVVDMVHTFMESLVVEERSDTVLWKADLKGAFTLLNFRPTDVSLFGCPLTDDLALFYHSGLFGWTGTPYCFQVLTRVLLRILSSRLFGKVSMYVDDIIGICMKKDLEKNFAIVREVCYGLLGTEAVAEDKFCSGRVLDILGWAFDLDKYTVSLSRINGLKVVYGFYHVDESKPVKVTTLEKLASWAARYTAVVRQAAPLTTVLYGQLGVALQTGQHQLCLSSATQSVIRLWRVLLLCVVGLDPTSFTRDLRSFVPKPPVIDLYFDASLEGVGVYTTWFDQPNTVITIVQVDFSSYFCLSREPKYQNTAEFMALVIGLISLAEVGVLSNASVRIIGDSTTALRWGTEERFKGQRATKAAMLFIALCCKWNAYVGSSVHVRGEDNIICDGLSRGTMDVETALAHCTHQSQTHSNSENHMNMKGTLLPKAIVMMDPTHSEREEAEFDVFWNELIQFLN
jgi:hypothetical protein